MSKAGNLIQIGFIRGAHALRGQVAVHVFSGNEEALSEYGTISNEDGSKTFEFTVTGDKHSDFLCTVKGIKDRTQAEALKGTKLFVAEDALPEPGEDEFYFKDLIGLTALDANGTTLGVVRQVTDFGNNDALEIEFTHTGTAALEKPQLEYILFTKQNVPELNIAAGTLVVDVPYGLFDTPEKT